MSWTPWRMVNTAQLVWDGPLLGDMFSAANQSWNSFFLWVCCACEHYEEQESLSDICLDVHIAIMDKHKALCYV